MPFYTGKARAFTMAIAMAMVSAIPRLLWLGYDLRELGRESVNYSAAIPKELYVISCD